MYQQAVPTSIGTPLVTYFKLSSLFEASVEGIFEMTKIYFTGRGNTDLKWNARLDSSATYEQRALFTNDVSCGSQTSVELSHKSEFRVKMENGVNSMKAVMSFPDREELVTFSIRSGEDPCQATQTTNQFSLDLNVCKDNMFNQERSLEWS